MSVLYVALPVAILMGGAALYACLRCIACGQFDDLETPAVRMLIDDETEPAAEPAPEEPAPEEPAPEEPAPEEPDRR